MPLVILLGALDVLLLFHQELFHPRTVLAPEIISQSTHVRTFPKVLPPPVVPPPALVAAQFRLTHHRLLTFVFVFLKGVAASGGALLPAAAPAASSRAALAPGVGVFPVAAPGPPADVDELATRMLGAAPVPADEQCTTDEDVSGVFHIGC